MPTDPTTLAALAVVALAVLAVVLWPVRTPGGTLGPPPPAVVQNRARVALDLLEELRKDGAALHLADRIGRHEADVAAARYAEGFAAPRPAPPPPAGLPAPTPPPNA